MLTTQATLKSDSHLPTKFIFICFNESFHLNFVLNFILKALFVLKIFKICLDIYFGHVEETAYLER